MNVFCKLFLPAGITAVLFGGTQALSVNTQNLFAAGIVGIVSDENGDPIENAAVVISAGKTPGKKNDGKKTSTDSEGAYEIDKLKKGKYKLTVVSTGYETASKTVTLRKNSDEIEENFTMLFSSYEKTNDTGTTDAAVAAYKEIGTLRKIDPIDGDAIASAYDGELQELVLEIDAEYNLALDSDISGAIEDITNDAEPKLAAQVIDKTLQRVFYLEVLEQITNARDDFDEDDTDELSQYWDNAYAAYQALTGTADKQNKILTADRTGITTGSNPNLEDQITVAFIRGRKAINKKNSAEDEITLGVQRQVIRLSLVRAFYMATLGEIEELLDARSTDVEEARILQKEAEVYYKIVEEFVSQDNPTGNETIKSQLTGDLNGVSADTLVSEMSRGFIGRVKDELESNEEALDGDERGDAVITAKEAQLYASVFLEDLELRLGSDEREKIEDSLNDLNAASNSVDVPAADTARQEITSVISSYEGELQ